MRRTRTRTLVAIIVALTLTTIWGASLVSAAPTNAKKAQTLTLVCGGLSFEIVLNGNGTFTPGHIIGDTQKFIPVSISIVATDASGAVLFQDTTTKGGQRKGQQGSLLNCTFSDTFTDPDLGEVTISGEAVAFMTPRNQR